MRSNFKSLLEWCKENNRKDIISIWDSESNLPLTMDQVSKGQNIQVCWKCKKCGYIWKNRISAVTHSKYGCPRCSRKLNSKRLVAKRGSLYDVAPWLSEEFMSGKNKTTIKDITPHSNLKYYWKCKKCGYVWLASAATRVKGHGCPACNHLVATKKYNLATEYPEIARQWHPTKNGSLTPRDILPYSEKKIWWRCDKGHEWEATPSNRVQGRNCRQCSNEMRTSFPEQCLVYYLSPYFKLESRTKVNGWEADIMLLDYNIAIEYDGIAYHDRLKLEQREIEKNEIFKKSGISLIRVKESYERSGIDGDTIFFLVDQKYSNLQNAILWLTDLLARKTGVVIPKDNINIEKDRLEIYKNYITYEKKNSFGYNFPELKKYWNNEKNGDMTPVMFSRMSNKHVWWKCPVCHGEWSESIINVAKGNRCPFCSGHRVLVGFNDLKTREPEIASEWDFEANAGSSPTMFTPGSNMTVNWKCKNGHKWKKEISYRVHSQRECPYCNGTKRNRSGMAKSKDDAKWLKIFKLAEKYYKEYGDLLVPSKYVSDDGTRLGYWIRTQRSFYSNGTLSDERTNALNSIGMIWKCK